MKTTVLEDKLFKMLKDNLADLWQDDLIAEAGQKTLQEKWSKKYKSSINCSHPKGFSQKAHCAGKKKHNESMQVMEMTCPDCGMCETHGNLNEIKKGAKDSNGFTKCWPGHHAAGTKKGKNGGQVRICVPNEGVAEATGDEKFDKMLKGITGKKAVAKQQKTDTKQQARDAFGSMFGGGNPADKLDIRKKGVAEGGPYDLPGKDYDRAGDEPRKPSRGKNNPYPFSKEEDDDYFREIFRKKREAKENDKDVAEDWNKVNHHDHTNGLSQKAVNSYRREHPGSKLKTAVTTKPSKLKAGSKAAKRRKSFCARMGGNKGPMKTPSGKPTPKALALRRWHCESLEELLVTARQRIYEAEGEPEGLKHLTPHLAKDILDQIEKEGVHAIVKSIEWGDGGAKELINIIKRELKKVAND